MPFADVLKSNWGLKAAAAAQESDESNSDLLHEDMPHFRVINSPLDSWLYISSSLSSIYLFLVFFGAFSL